MDERETRDVLLEAAGQVFAEKGFDRATGKEICARAGANTAAVNYYFGGIDGLYAAVLKLAHSHVVTVDRLRALVTEKTDLGSRLEAIIGTMIGVITEPASSSWMFRVIGREVVAPSPVFAEMRDKEIFPKMKILKAVIAEFLGRPESDPAVERGCLAVIGPCVVLLIGDRRFLKRAFPNLGLRPDDAKAVTQHFVRHAIGGLAAIKAEL